jgi:hypothetical protein
MALCAGQGNRVTATVVSPGVRLPVSNFNSVQVTARSINNQGGTPQLLRGRHVFNRVLIKVAPKGGGKTEGKVFTLRNVDNAMVSSCNQLKELIQEQLSDDIIRSCSFDVGYINVVRN